MERNLAETPLGASAGDDRPVLTRQVDRKRTGGARWAQ